MRHFVKIFLQQLAIALFYPILSAIVLLVIVVPTIWLFQFSIIYSIIWLILVVVGLNTMGEIYGKD